MPEFHYKAKDAQGAAHAGTISAPNKNLAATQLRERGWVVLAIEGLIGQKPGRNESWFGDSFLWERLPPRSIHVELSLQQLAMMIRSGMTLLASIRSITDQSPQRSLARTWQQIAGHVQRGRGLSEAMQMHGCFPGFVVRLVQVGEQTGNLEAVLSRAASTMRDRRHSREAFVSATIYPALILILSVFVTMYMVVYLIPRLEIYLQSLGKQMPAMTQGLIDASYWLRHNHLLVLLGFVVASTSGALIYLSREGRLWVDRNLLLVPIIGRLIQLGETATLSRSLSMMLKSGITLTEGLGAVENILGNRFLRRTVSTAREKVIRGSNLVDALKQKKSFTPLLGQMVAVGEQSGELSAVLNEVAELHESQFRSLVKRMNAILTPALTIVIGGVVGYVYIAFFMALVAAGS